MKKQLLLLFLLFCLGCGPTQVVDISKIGSAVLIRSPQPDEDDIEDFKKEYGLKTIINLRGPSNDEWYYEERAACNKLNIYMLDLDASGRREPTDEEIEEFLSVVTNPGRWPVLIHCQAGIHRTGVYVAVYRIYVQKWTPQQALDELEDNYFNWTTADRSAVIRWLRALDNVQRE